MFSPFDTRIPSPFAYKRTLALCLKKRGMQRSFLSSTKPSLVGCRPAFGVAPNATRLIRPTACTTALRAA
eukprot:207163-Chlamydomonas_euryale.AAC.1